MIGGHGWIIPRADGARARCGGPVLCPECAREQAMVLARSSGHYPSAREQELERLSAAHDSLLRAAVLRAEAAERRVTELEAALRPFAALARVTTQDPNLHYYRVGGGVLEWTWSAVHPDWVDRARAALRGAEEGATNAETE